MLKKTESQIESTHAFMWIVLFSVLSETGKQFLEYSLKYILFPILSVAAWMKVHLAWKEKEQLNKNNTLTIKFALEVLSALALTAATISAFVWASVFVVLTPIIFTAILAAKTLFHGALSFFYLGKASLAEENTKETYMELCITNCINFVAMGASAFGAGLVFATGPAWFALLGVLGSSVALGYALYYDEIFLTLKAEARLTNKEPAVVDMNANPVPAFLYLSPQYIAQNDCQSGSQMNKAIVKEVLDLKKENIELRRLNQQVEVRAKIAEYHLDEICSGMNALFAKKIKSVPIPDADNIKSDSEPESEEVARLAAINF